MKINDIVFVFDRLGVVFLLSSSIDFNDIKINHSDKPVIFYNWSGSMHRYFPDCYLPKLNMIVETKSPWTWEFQKDRNLSKVSASLDNGYDVRLITWEATRNSQTLVSDIIYKSK